VIKSKMHVDLPKGSMKQTFDGTPHVSAISQTEDVEAMSTYESAEKVIYQQTRSDHFWEIEVEGQKTKTQDPASSLTGEKIVCEKKNGKWVSHLESGKKLDEIGDADLARWNPGQEIQDELALYGSEPRKVGDKWEANLSKLSTFASIVKPKGKLSAEFVKITEVNGEKCAEIRFTFDLAGNGDDESTTVKAKGERLVHRSLADRINRDEKTTDSTIAHVDAPDDQNPEVEVTGDTTIEETAEVSKASKN